jgi:hypothetical protein
MNSLENRIDELFKNDVSLFKLRSGVIDFIKDRDEELKNKLKWYIQGTNVF